MSYFVPHKPTSGEHGTYNRSTSPFFWDTPGTITWVWRFAQGYTPPVGQRVRMRVDSGSGPVAVSDWQLPGTDGYYSFSFDLPDGHYLACPELENLPSIKVLVKAFLVNRSGAPLPTQTPFTATTRFELTYNNQGNVGVIQLADANNVPVPTRKPLKPREIIKSDILPTKAQQWVRKIQANNGSSMTRRVVELPTGDKAICEDQKYFYNTSTTLGSHPVGKVPPLHTAQDGPRGIGTLGTTYKVSNSPSGRGFYGMDTTGRLFFMSWEGTITTFAGWYLKQDVTPGHPGLLDKLNQYYGTAKFQANTTFYNSKWTHAGDWDQVPGAKTFFEPWGFHQELGHEFWICDTLNHRILFGDHWTAHGATSFEPAHFPPIGYVQASAPTGKMTMALYAGSTDGTPSTLINEPWDIARGPDGKLYWTNYGNNSICRANIDGSNIETVVWSSLHPTDAQLGISKRLDKGTNPSTLRQTWLIDGPVGTASCVRPQAIAFNSEGKLIWAERYTYAIRELDLTTMMVRTVNTIIDVDSGSTSSGNNDIAMAIDVNGTVGPKDDIFVACWGHGTDKRFAKDGTARGQWAFTSGVYMANGPLDKCHSGSYAWAVGVCDGRLIRIGNAAGWQCLEITRKLPTDPTPDYAKWTRGRAAVISGVVPSMVLDHGPEFQGELGFPNYEEFGGWTDTQIKDYLRARGIAETSLDDVLYFLRWEAVDLDYSTSPPPDTTAPNPPTVPLTLQGISNMYQIRLSGVTGPEADMAAVRVYFEGGVTEVAATSNAAFVVDLLSSTHGDKVVEHSFVDAAGNESAKFAQTISVPDYRAPAAPVAPLSLVSVVWGV